MASALDRARLEPVRRDPEEKHGRDQERGRVQPVRELWPLRGDQDAAQHRPDHPRQVLRRLQDRVGVRQVFVRDEVRHPRIHRRPEEAGGDPGERREDDDRAPGSPRTATRRRPTTRARSDATSRRLREKRSTSGPSSNPITMIGRKSAIRSALTHVPDPVRSKTSTVSASAARYVPAPEPSVASRSRR